MMCVISWESRIDGFSPLSESRNHAALGSIEGAARIDSEINHEQARSDL